MYVIRVTTDGEFKGNKTLFRFYNGKWTELAHYESIGSCLWYPVRALGYDVEKKFWSPFGGLVEKNSITFKCLESLHKKSEHRHEDCLFKQLAKEYARLILFSIE